MSPLLGKTKHHLKQWQLQPSRCSDLNLEVTPDLALIPRRLTPPRLRLQTASRISSLHSLSSAPRPGPVSHRLLPRPECFSLLTRLLPTAACAPFKRQAPAHGASPHLHAVGSLPPWRPIGASRSRLQPTPLPVLAAGQDPDGPCDSPLPRRYLEPQTGVAGILGTVQNTGREGASESQEGASSPSSATHQLGDQGWVANVSEPRFPPVGQHLPAMSSEEVKVTHVRA